MPWHSCRQRCRHPLRVRHDMVRRRESVTPTRLLARDKFLPHTIQLQEHARDTFLPHTTQLQDHRHRLGSHCLHPDQAEAPRVRERQAQHLHGFRSTCHGACTQNPVRATQTIINCRRARSDEHSCMMGTRRGKIYSTRGSMLLFALAWYFSGPVYLYPCQFRPSWPEVGKPGRHF
jgi:hypothetical protein